MVDRYGTGADQFFFSRCRNSPTLEIFTLRMVKEKLSCSALARQAKENMYLLRRFWQPKIYVFLHTPVHSFFFPVAFLSFFRRAKITSDITSSAKKNLYLTIFTSCQCADPA